ncbi:hypothetical protein [Echinicola rosea]|uniref:Phage protein n=1 Tax=Echinicola rosea TaxID=1807691 RepID=A0ABQ1V299_9BACT|nr:hypothetical protein [Echinicola rosea]GGF35643.1 hypothetical protein GCM10011339_25010 [Echinicola rosea]
MPAKPELGAIDKYPKDMIIVFNRNEAHTAYIDTSVPHKNSFQYRREGFRDTLFFIQVSHGLQYKTIKIKKTDLDNMVVRFDAEMGIEDWIYMDVLNYYIIFQDEYLSEKSLDRNYEFTAYEVELNIGEVVY